MERVSTTDWPLKSWRGREVSEGCAWGMGGRLERVGGGTYDLAFVDCACLVEDGDECVHIDLCLELGGVAALR